MILTPEELWAQAQQMSVAAPQAAALGLELISIEPGRATARIPWREDLVGNPATAVIAGGVVTTLLDHTCGIAVQSIATPGGPTLDLRIDYMRPAGSRASVIASAHCYRLTRSIAFVRAHAYDLDADDPIATAQATFALHEPIASVASGS